MPACLPACLSHLLCCNRAITRRRCSHTAQIKKIFLVLLQSKLLFDPVPDSSQEAGHNPTADEVALHKLRLARGIWTCADAMLYIMKGALPNYPGLASAPAGTHVGKFLFVACLVVCISSSSAQPAAHMLASSGESRMGILLVMFAFTRTLPIRDSLLFSCMEHSNGVVAVRCLPALVSACSHLFPHIRRRGSSIFPRSRES